MNTLVSCGLLTEEESTAGEANTIAFKRVTAMKEYKGKAEAMSSEMETMKKEYMDMKKKMEEMEAKMTEAKNSKAKEVVDSAVNSGRVAAKDESTKEELTELLVSAKNESQFASRKAMIESMTIKHEGIDKAIVSASQGGKVNSGSNSIVSAANKLVEAGTSKNFDEAIVKAALSDPEGYDQYLESLTK